MSQGALGRQWHFEHHDDSYAGGSRIEAYDAPVPPDSDSVDAEMTRQQHFAGALHYYEGHPDSYFHRADKHLGVDDLEVVPEHQRHGVATAMYGELHRRYPEHVVVHHIDGMTQDSLRLADHLVKTYPGKHDFFKD